MKKTYLTLIIVASIILVLLFWNTEKQADKIKPKANNYQILFNNIYEELEGKIADCLISIAKGNHSLNFDRTFEKINQVNNGWQGPSAPTFVPYGLRAVRLLYDHIEVNNKAIIICNPCALTNISHALNKRLQ